MEQVSWLTATAWISAFPGPCGPVACRRNTRRLQLREQPRLYTAFPLNPFRELLTLGRTLQQRPQQGQLVCTRSLPCRRWINERKKTRLKRSWQDEETCSSSVELTLSAVTGVTARTVA